MSMYRGHLVGGLASYCGLVLILSLFKINCGYYFLGFLATLAGSLFPDIDIYSQGQKLFLKILFILLVISLFMKASLPVIGLLCFSLLPILIPHRGLFHDLTFILLLLCIAGASCIYLMPDKREMILSLLLFFLVGVISHLLLDKGFKKTFRKTK